MTPAKTIATEGASRQKIRVYEETVGGSRLIRVRWRENGKRLTRSWPYTSDNKATAKVFAKGLAEGREIRVTMTPLTLRELWDRYSEAEFPNLRAKSQKLYKEYFARWETMWGKDFVAANTTLSMVTEFRTALTKQGKAISTIRHSIETVKMVYTWGAMQKFVPVSDIALYKFKIGKDARKAPPAEYRTEEFQQILAQLDPAKATEWRAFVALAICGFQGVRQNSVLHLQWCDIGVNEITWRAKWDKVGREWKQPIREGTRLALGIAARWTNLDVHGPWVLPSGSSKNRGDCYTIGALYLALCGAEERAGIKHLKQRGAHGLRRMLAGDIATLTGDATLAMRSIGDTDMKQAPKYIQKRDDALEDAFRRLDTPEGATKP